MKTVGDFLAGKLRRAEVEDRLTLTRGGPPHDRLGAHEGTLTSAIGTATFYASGLVIGSSEVRYDALAKIELAPTGVRLSTEATTLTIHASPAGAVVIHAALRWIGHTILRRDLSD